MKTVNIMLKPASSLCNMRCRYCFYKDVSDLREIRSYGIMTDETVEALLDSLATEFSAGDRINIVFQGGEPTLAGLPFFKKFVALCEKKISADISYAIQTNALLTDGAWCDFFKHNRFLVGISFDMLPDEHDRARVDAVGDGTFKRVAASIERLKRHGVDFNVLCTLTNSLARHPLKVWKQLTRLGVDYIQFTPCMGELEGVYSEYALTPQRFASFYTALFASWYDSYKSGQLIHVKLFDDIINQLILGRPTQCGMNGICTPQLVIEADGSAFPCDFYCIDGYKLGNITSMTVSELLRTDAARAFTEREHSRPEICAACRYRGFCGGNCKRMQREICVGADKGFCGYRSLLDGCGNTLAALADEARRAYKKDKKQ